MKKTISRSEKNLMVTAYIPIFREKLNRLESRGKGNSDEAVQLRRTLARADEFAAQAEAKQTNRFFNMVAD